MTDTFKKLLEQEESFENSHKAASKNTFRSKNKPARRPCVDPNGVNYIEAYLFCPCLNRREIKGDVAYIFEQGLYDLDARIAEQPIFLTQQNAFQYSRFMGNDHMILKAYVPEAAIQGRSQQLIIKKGFINKHHVQGCFLPGGKEKVYHANPYFEL